ncbi:MAG: hypothetical protein K2X11_07870 [Acetobacteraceae bacterium]|nr:hypothetical protein [Acetobacteraceae bacterium]
MSANDAAIRLATDAPPAGPQPAPDRYLAGRPREERLAGLVAFALATEAREAATDETVAARRREADRLLTEHAFRLLHNQVAEIRREAVAEHMAALRPPLGFWGIAAACGTALAVFGVVALWLIAHPGSLAALTALLGG